MRDPRYRHTLTEIKDALRERNSRIVERAINGATKQDLAREFALSASQVERIIRPYVMRKRTKDCRARNEEIARRVAAGENRKLVAREFGVSVAQVGKIIALYGRWVFVWYNRRDARTEDSATQGQYA